jgi:hypothetical protein
MHGSESSLQSLRYEVLTVVNTKIVVYVMTPCGLKSGYRHF